VATREEFYTALRNADAAGDNEGAAKLASYIQSLPDAASPKSPTVSVSTAQGHDWLGEIALHARAAAEGVVNTLALPSDMQTRLQNKITDAVLSLTGVSQKDREASQQPTIAERFSTFMDKAGAYHPETDREQMATAITRGVAGAAAGAGVTGTMSIGGNALRAAISGGTGGASAEYARQRGASPLVQTLAGLAGGVAPYALEGAVTGGVRRLVRGGEAGRQDMGQNIQDFEQSGTTPTVGQAVENRRSQTTESLLSRTPGGSGPMIAKAKEQAEQIGKGLDDLADSMAGATSAEKAGRAVQTGIKSFSERFRARGDQLYGELDRHVPQDTAVNINNTRAALSELTAKIQGAEQTSSLLTNPRLKAISDALEGDLSATNTIPYEAVKALRTRVGKLVGQPELVSEIPKAEIRRLYGALSEDMGSAARQVDTQLGSSAASAAFDRANQYWSAGLKRIDVLDDVISAHGGPEAIFKATLSGTREGATTLRAVMQSLPEDAQKTLTATVIRRLGIAKPGAQNEMGDIFSTETFLTNWNSLSPQAKSALFDRYGAGFSQSMDRVARVASNLREGSKVFANPSGTNQAIGLTAAVGAFFGSLFSGNWPVAAGVASGVGGANVTARLMSNPDFVKWLAKTTTAPASALPALATQLAAKADKQNDPDLKSAADQFKLIADHRN
jgi:hypothetical protein